MGRLSLNWLFSALNLRAQINIKCNIQYNYEFHLWPLIFHPWEPVWTVDQWPICCGIDTVPATRDTCWVCYTNFVNKICRQCAMKRILACFRFGIKSTFQNRLPETDISFIWAYSMIQLLKTLWYKGVIFFQKLSILFSLSSSVLIWSCTPWDISCKFLANNCV